MNRFFIENSNTTLRKVLNNEENLDIVKNLIEAILNIKVKKIILRPYLKEESMYLPRKEKYGITTVRIIDEEDKQYNIGIQFMDGLYLQEKMLTFGISIYLNQTLYDDYNDKVNTLTINFLDFNGFRSNAFHKIITFLEGNDYYNLNLRDEIKLHTIELPKFNKNTIETKEDEWITYFKGEDTELIDKIKEKNQYIKKLDDLLLDYWKNEVA